MSGRTLGVLMVVAIVAVGAAFLATRGRSVQSAPEPGTRDALLMPEIKRSIDDIASLRISDAQGSVHLVRDADGVWTAESLGGYPAKPNAISQLMVALANQDLGEAKTNDPSLFAELGVNDPPLTGKSSMITVERASGEPIASVIFGKISESVVGDRFVRVMGQDRARLISVRFSPSTAVTNWVDPALTRIPISRLESIMIERPDFPPIVIDREQGGTGTPTFAVQGIPDGTVTKRTGALEQVVGAAAWLDFESAMRPTSDPTESSAITTTFRTVDGWSVSLQTWIDGGRTMARIEVLDPAAMPEGEAGARIDADLAALRARVQGWDFQIARARFDSLRPSLSELITDRDPGASAAPSENGPE